LSAAPQLSPLLTAREVAVRYRCDTRAARRIMRDAGALQAAGRLLVPLDRLIAWEEEQAAQLAARREATVEGGVSRRRRLVAVPRPSGPGWWQES
jgi:hypothetical protein